MLYIGGTTKNKSSMNILTISGTLGKDAEVKELASKVLVSLSVAVDAFRKGERTTQWVRVSWWHNQHPNANMLALYVKGAKIGVSGEASASAYLKQGEAVPVLELLAHRVEFVASPRQQEQPATSQPQAQYGTKNSVSDDDLPF